MTSRMLGVTVNYARTLDHLRAWKLVLPSGVREVMVALSTKNKIEHAGTMLFLRQNVPQLKYHNPSVQFSVTSRESDKSEIIIISDDSSSQRVVDTTGLQWRDIQQQLNKQFSLPEHSSSHDHAPITLSRDHQ